MERSVVGEADLQAAGCKILCNVAKHDAHCQETPASTFAHVICSGYGHSPVY